MTYSLPGKVLTLSKCSHSEEVAQTSHSRCLDTLQPEKVRHENYTSPRVKARDDKRICLFVAIQHIYYPAHYWSVIYTHHISDVQDLSGHGLFVVGWSWSKPQLLECLIHQFLKGTQVCVLLVWIQTAYEYLKLHLL